MKNGETILVDIMPIEQPSNKSNQKFYSLVLRHKLCTGKIPVDSDYHSIARVKNATITSVRNYNNTGLLWQVKGYIEFTLDYLPCGSDCPVRDIVGVPFTVGFLGTGTTPNLSINTTGFSRALYTLVADDCSKTSDIVELGYPIIVINR